MSIEELDIIHKDLRRYRWFYYEAEEPQSLISDYEYDMLEKLYEKECDKLGIVTEKRITNYIGFDIAIPMSLNIDYGS